MSEQGLVKDPKSKKLAPLTERQMVDRLRSRYEGENGNGPAAVTRPADGPRPLPAGFDRSFLVAIIRQAFKITNVAPAELRAAHEEGYRAGTEAGERSAALELERLRRLDGQVRDFEEALGYPIRGYRAYFRDGNPAPAEVGRILRAILDGDTEITGLRNRLSAAADNAERLARDARQRVEALDAALEPRTVQEAGER